MVLLPAVAPVVGRWTSPIIPTIADASGLMGIRVRMPILEERLDTRLSYALTIEQSQDGETFRHVSTSQRQGGPFTSRDGVENPPDATVRLTITAPWVRLVLDVPSPMTLGIETME